MHVDCPRCRAWVQLVDADKGAWQRCSSCGNVFAALDMPASDPLGPVEDDISATAEQLVLDNRRLDIEAQRWKAAFIKLARDLKPRAQAEAACLVAGLDDNTTRTFLETLDALRGRGYGDE